MSGRVVLGKILGWTGRIAGLPLIGIGIVAVAIGMNSTRGLQFVLIGLAIGGAGGLLFVLGNLLQQVLDKGSKPFDVNYGILDAMRFFAAGPSRRAEPTAMTGPAKPTKAPRNNWP